MPRDYKLKKIIMQRFLTILDVSTSISLLDRPFFHILLVFQYFAEWIIDPNAFAFGNSEVAKVCLTCVFICLLSGESRRKASANEVVRHRGSAGRSEFPRSTCWHGTAIPRTTRWWVTPYSCTLPFQPSSTGATEYNLPQMPDEAEVQTANSRCQD